MKKYRLLILLITFAVLSAIGYMVYANYNQYRPSVGIEHAKNLDQALIDRIKTQTPITKVHVFKANRTLELLHQDQIIRRYHMRLEFSPTGHKIQEGDGKTPEGRYILDWRNQQSAFYKSLHVSYPNAADQAKAAEVGVSPGGDIMIHGSAATQQVNKLPSLMNYFPNSDWTWGCVAVRNVDMNEIWQLVDNDTPIEIFP